METLLKILKDSKTYKYAIFFMLATFFGCLFEGCDLNFAATLAFFGTFYMFLALVLPLIILNKEDFDFWCYIIFALIMSIGALFVFPLFLP